MGLDEPITLLKVRRNEITAFNHLFRGLGKACFVTVDRRKRNDSREIKRDAKKKKQSPRRNPLDKRHYCGKLIGHGATLSDGCKSLQPGSRNSLPMQYLREHPAFGRLTAYLSAQILREVFPNVAVQTSTEA
jgi:hypothetical protein